MRKLIFACLCCVPYSGAYAQNMPLSEYMIRTEALVQKQHYQASAEYMRLREELNRAMVIAQAERRTARKEARDPLYCLAPGRPATNSQELAKHFASIPAEQRANVTVSQALMQLLQKKFPCKTS